MKLTYQHTMVACFVGYILQAIVNNFVPLLFLTFQNTYDISLPEITFLVTLNFGLQLLVDMLAAFFVDKIGYRCAIALAHGFVAAGFLCLMVLPDMLPNAYLGIALSVVIYAIGGGLLEVVVSPIVEACPTKHKESAMSLLHSFYCWGYVGVVLISTIFFAVAGIQHWRILTVLWIAIALGNLVLLAKTPMATLIEEGKTGFSFGKLLSQKIFWILLLMMICAGASEQAVSQWASILAEKGLGVSKTLGDLAGPMTFALLMGSSRAIYGKFGSKLNLEKCMMGSCLLCVVSYLTISLVSIPVVNLLGCGICGFSVGIMWPGSFSQASKALPLGGTMMFALLALGGDIGCAAGPTLAGAMASAFQDNLQMGVLFAVIFPLGLLLLMRFMKQEK